MNDLEIRQHIKKRMEELEPLVLEFDQLSKAHAALSGDLSWQGVIKERRSPNPSKGRRRGRPVEGEPTMDTEISNLLKVQPLALSELCENMMQLHDRPKASVHRKVKRMSEEGKLTRTSDGLIALVLSD